MWGEEGRVGNHAFPLKGKYFRYGTFWCIFLLVVKYEVEENPVVVMLGLVRLLLFCSGGIHSEHYCISGKYANASGVIGPMEKDGFGYMFLMLLVSNGCRKCAWSE